MTKKRAKTTVSLVVILLLINCLCCSLRNDWHGTYCSLYCQIAVNGSAVQLCIQSCMEN